MDATIERAARAARVQARAHLERELNVWTDELGWPRETRRQLRSQAFARRVQERLAPFRRAMEQLARLGKVPPPSTEEASWTTSA